jgi:hypothetical protein
MSATVEVNPKQVVVLPAKYTVSFEMTQDELNAFVNLIGNIGGRGPARKVTSPLWYRLRDHRTEYLDSVKDIYFFS